jgi:hypothetical protein
MKGSPIRAFETIQTPQKIDSDARATTKDSLNNNFPKFAFFILATQNTRRYTQVPQSASIGVQSSL